MMGDRFGIDWSNNTLFDHTFEDFIRSFDLTTCFFSFFLNVLVARTLIMTRSREVTTKHFQFFSGLLCYLMINSLLYYYMMLICNLRYI